MWHLSLPYITCCDILSHAINRMENKIKWKEKNINNNLEFKGWFMTLYSKSLFSVSWPQMSHSNVENTYGASGISCYSSHYLRFDAIKCEFVFVGLHWDFDTFGKVKYHLCFSELWACNKGMSQTAFLSYFFVLCENKMGCSRISVLHPKELRYVFIFFFIGIHWLQFPYYLFIIDFLTSSSYSTSVL